MLTAVLPLLTASACFAPVNLRDLGLEVLRLPVALALGIVVVAEEHARVQDVHHFLASLFAEKFCAGHGVAAC